MALSACDDGDPPARGFDSRQLVQLRDPGFSFVESVGRVVIYSTGQDAAKTYWTVDIETGEVEDHGASRPDYIRHRGRPGSSAGPQRPLQYVRPRLSTTSRSAELTIVDRQTGARTAIGPIDLLGAGLSDGGGPAADRLAARRRGSYHPVERALRRPPAGASGDRDPDVGHRGLDVYLALAGTPTQPEALGLYRIDYRSFAVTELVPAATGTPAWAPGATP